MSHADFAQRDHFHVTVGNAVRLAREDAGLTQDQLAKAAGITKYTLGNGETGHPLSAYVLAMIAKRLGRPITEIIPPAATEKP